MSGGDLYFCLPFSCDGQWRRARHGASILAKKCFDTFTGSLATLVYLWTKVTWAKLWTIAYPTSTSSFSTFSFENDVLMNSNLFINPIGLKKNILIVYFIKIQFLILLFCKVQVRFSDFICIQFVQKWLTVRDLQFASNDLNFKISQNFCDRTSVAIFGSFFVRWWLVEWKVMVLAWRYCIIIRAFAVWLIVKRSHSDHDIVCAVCD